MGTGCAWPRGNDPGGLHRCDHLKPKLLIAIKDQVFGRGFKGKHLAQLLNESNRSSDTS
jgi:hypothetical protein